MVFMDVLKDGGSIQNAEQCTGENLNTITQYAKNATSKNPEILILLNSLVEKARSR